MKLLIYFSKHIFSYIHIYIGKTALDIANGPAKGALRDYIATTSIISPASASPSIISPASASQSTPVIVESIYKIEPKDIMVFILIFLYFLLIELLKLGYGKIL